MSWLISCNSFNVSSWMLLVVDATVTEWIGVSGYSDSALAMSKEGTSENKAVSWSFYSWSCVWNDEVMFEASELAWWHPACCVVGPHAHLSRSWTSWKCVLNSWQIFSPIICPPTLRARAQNLLFVWWESDPFLRSSFLSMECFLVLLASVGFQVVGRGELWVQMTAMSLTWSQTLF